MSAPAPTPPTSGGSRTGPRLLVLLCGAWFSFWACAPPSTLPAPIPMAKGGGIELGGAGVLSLASGEDCRIPEDAAFDTGRYYVPQCTDTVVPLGDIFHYGVVPLSDQWALGWQVGGGTGTPGLVGGAMARYDFTKNKRMLVGPQLELGVAWGSLGLPASFQVGDKVWLYTHPSVGYRMNGLGRVPVGVGLPIGDRLRLDVEAGYALPVMQGIYTRYESFEGGRTWIGAGLSTRVGD